jgi:uncharacterized protein (DUF849 family)
MITDMLQVCLNGARTRSECAHLPVTPRELAEAAALAVAAGAVDIHLHPKDRDGRDSLDAVHVDTAVAAVRAAVPGIPVGVTTGAWTLADPRRRAERVEAWTVLPDHASVNWHEDGAAHVADALLARGIGVEAGIYSSADGLARFLAWPRADQVLRVLAEVTDAHPRTAAGAAVELLEEVAAATALPILLHGQDGAAWDIVRMAAERGLDTRIGLEDTLRLPDGSAAADNADLVRAARDIIGRQVRRRG